MGGVKKGRGPAAAPPFVPLAGEMGGEWDRVEAALLGDGLPAVSERCAAGGEAEGAGSSSHSFDFPGEAPAGTWNPEFAPLEAEAYLLQMSHEDGNRSWAVRVGRGGSVYSLRGEFGEAMPPQRLEGAPWVDTVLQWVGVDTGLNDPAAGRPWFVHQAGAYMRDPDLEGHPFYSPTLAARCTARECSVSSWGQQAHVPTNFTSPILFTTRLRDCGRGVLEYSVALHNMGESRLKYFNVPWTAVRSASLRDVFHGSGSGEEIGTAFPTEWDWPSPGLRHLNPVPSFGEDLPIPSAAETGGYTLFAQEVEARTPFPAPKGLSLVIGAGGCRASPGHSKSWSLSTVKCSLEPLPAEPSPNSCRQCDLILRVVERDVAVRIRGVLHWAYQAKSLYFWPAEEEGTPTAAEIFAPGDVLRVERPPGKPWDENLALGFVHGVDARSRVRVGGTNPRRDAVVYTVNYMQAEVAPGETLVKRSYILSGPLKGMAEEVEAAWVPETSTNLLTADYAGQGRALHLFIAKEDSPTDDSPQSFGVGLAEDFPFCQGRCSSVCEGLSAPGPALRPLFSVSCGGAYYVGFDPYGLSPTSTSSVRPWRCIEGPDPLERPEWKVLGWFSPGEGGCDRLLGEKSRLDVDICEKLRRQNDGGDAGQEFLGDRTVPKTRRRSAFLVVIVTVAILGGFVGFFLHRRRRLRELRLRLAREQIALRGSL